MAEQFLVRDAPISLPLQTPAAVEPALAASLRSWAQTSASRTVYLGDCQIAQASRDAGKVCSAVTMVSDSTASVLMGLAFSDGGAMVTFRRMGSTWVQVNAIPFALPIEFFTPPAAAMSASRNAVDTVRAYYALLTQRDWPNAWRLLSAGYHAQRSYEQWVSDFSGIPYIALSSLTPGATPAEVTASVDATIWVDNRAQNTQWITDWRLAPEGGEWKLDVGIRRP